MFLSVAALPQGPPMFSFCNYSFVYDPASKARIMQLENACAQYEEFQSSVLQVGGGQLACASAVG
jgi:hypothetical protein